MAAVPYVVHGQASSDTLRRDALRVFMDATDFIRKEIPYINYVRDINDSQVYIISSSQATGSGGREFSYFLIGREKFTGMADTLVYPSSADDTEDQVRSGQVRVLRQGLMRYVRTTPLSKYISISFLEPLPSEVSSDPWNNWVFGTSVSGMLNGQKAYHTNELFADLSARRVTEEWKLEFGLDLNFNLDNYIIDNKNVRSLNRARSFQSLIVKSLGDHWSAGGTMGIESSTFSNYRLRYSLMPGIEYDIYPYSESARRQIRVLYSAGFLYHSYADTTIYDKMQESLWGQSLKIAYQTIQKWGSFNLSLEGFNYLNDWSKNNLSLYSIVNIRIARGLSFEIDGGAAMVHDQLSLVRGGATSEEILLRRRELATEYSYFLYFGLSYTFGSIYNNVVNPRFSGRTAGMDD
jgi:hypothetical protein